MHYDKDSYFVASGIRAFKPPLLKIYREYIKHRESLQVILEDLKEKGYKIPEPKYKRVPSEFQKEMQYNYLTRFGAMFAYNENQIDDTFLPKR